MNYDAMIDEFVELFQRGIRFVEGHMGNCSKGANGILYYLHCIHNGATSGELKEYFHIGSGGIANALKDLEEKGYITRQNSESDKRVVTVYITEKGTQVAHELIMEIKGNLKALFEAVGEDDTRALLRIITKAIALTETNVK